MDNPDIFRPHLVSIGTNSNLLTNMEQFGNFIDQSAQSGTIGLDRLIKAIWPNQGQNGQTKIVWYILRSDH